MPIHKVVALARASLEPLPLHELDSVDNLIAADAKDQFTARDPMEIVEDVQLIGSVDRFLGTLKLKEENVVRMRFGIGVQDSMTLEEIGARLDVTRERIRQIEAKALRRLRHPARLERFLAELGLAPDPSPSPEASGDSDDEANGEAAPEAQKAAAPKPAAPTPARPQQRTSLEPTALDKLLDQAREAGIIVEDYLEGEARRLWVHITNTPDGLNSPRRLRDAKGVSPQRVEQTGVCASGKKKFANCGRVAGRRKHQRRIPVIVARVEVVAAVDVDLDCTLDARDNGHSEESVQGCNILNRHVLHAGTLCRSMIWTTSLPTAGCRVGQHCCWPR